MCPARQVLVARGVMRMNEESCDIHDVAKAASDLVAVGCTIGLRHLADGTARLRFSAVVSAYADEVIQAVDQGVISAWQGVQDLVAEYEELASKAGFYLQNGLTVAAGVMQIRSGVASTAAPVAIGVIPGALLIAHGTNNVYEGLANIHNGPEVPITVGPIRNVYHSIFRGESEGNLVFYSMDLFLSGYGMIRPIRKPGAFELFRRDPVNYQAAFRQTGKVALALEAIIDFFTLQAVLKENSGRG